MTTDMRCGEVRELAAELALDIAAGKERAAGMRHLNGCNGCRQLVAELSEINDELLLSAPVREPPLGFESRVVGALSEPSQDRMQKVPTHRWRWLAIAAALVIAAALGGGSMFMATADDRQLAQGYRDTLTEGQGSFFAAASLRGSNHRVGTVFGYEGQPSWVTVTLQPAPPAGRMFEVQVVTRDGRYIILGEVALGGDNEVWGSQIPVDLSAVSQLRFVGPEGRTAFTAAFDGDGPWSDS
jgi:hypothetical protein